MKSETGLWAFAYRVKKAFKVGVDKQNAKGLEVYGQPLDPLDGKYDFLQMLEEEVVDAYQYLRAEREKKAYVNDKISHLVSKIDYVVSSSTADSNTKAFVNAYIEEIEKVLNLSEGKQFKK